MRIKSTVLQVLAAACLGAGLLYAMGIEGGAQQGGIDTAGLKNLEYLYKSYHALGGNGTGTELYNRAKALPIRD